MHSFLWLPIGYYTIHLIYMLKNMLCSCSVLLLCALNKFLWHILHFSTQLLHCHRPLTRYVKLQVAHARKCLERFPHHWLQRKTHVPWCMSESLTRGGRENVPGIPGACAIRNYAYLIRGPWEQPHCSADEFLKIWVNYEFEIFHTKFKHISLSQKFANLLLTVKSI